MKPALSYGRIISPTFSVLATLGLCLGQVGSVQAGLIYSLNELLVSADDPNNHVVGAGGNLDGVGDVILSLNSGGAIRCTGSLLPTGRHLLTAGHCVTDDNGVLDVSNATVSFSGDNGTYVASAQSFTEHPDWDGDLFRGNDLAIVELTAEVPEEISRYDLYTASNEVGLVHEKTGYGTSGTGDTGAVLSSGTKRTGNNVYDSTSDLMLSAFGLTPGVDFVAGGVLQFDFDNGLAANDAFGFFFGLSDLGLGSDEVNSAPGDSGGPTFIDGLIAGVTSYGVSLQFSNGSTADVDQPASTNSSFGEFSGDTRVSHYADWIYDTIGYDPNAQNNNDPVSSVANVPTYLLMAVALFLRPRRKNRLGTDNRDLRHL